MYKNVKISVIIPVYNVEKYLAECLDSVLHQTHTNLEIIVVNDGSCDESGKIADLYVKKDERIVVIHKANGGVSSARNAGLEVSTGEYVCFVDGDDRILEDYVEYLLRLIKENDAELSLSVNMFSNYCKKQIRKDRLRVCTAQDAMEKILCGGMPIGCYSKMFKRAFLGTDVRFNTELYIGEGFNFNIAAFQKAAKIVEGKRRIYFYRLDNENSATTKFSERKWRNGIEAMQVMKCNFSIRSKRIEKAWKCANWRTVSGIYNLIVLSKSKEKCEELYRYCKKISKKEAASAFFVPTSFREKCRAFLFWISPNLVPNLILLKRKMYRLKVKNISE